MNRCRAGRTILAAAAMILCGCSMRPLMVDQMAAMMAEGIPAYEQEADLVLLRQAFPAHIKLLEVLQQNDPDHPGIHLMLAQLYGSYAFAVVEHDLDRLQLQPPGDDTAGEQKALLLTRADRCYRRGAEHALAVLNRRHDGIEGRLARIASIDETLAAMTADDVPALFWYAFNLGSRVNHNRGDLRLVAQAHRAEGAMRRVVELQPDFYHGAAHIFLMSYYAAQPMALGGRCPQADAHYQALNEMPGAARVAAAVFYARDVLVRRQQREAFASLLAEAGRRAAGGEITGLLDRVAMERATLLAAAVDRLFAKDLSP